mmetsp:Transcript_43596/g.52842  ORF Transcript_43596/g.52842 Transcript_43596/m.52842 type:complete len:98 (-) Transcript_43596:460-753(-)
MKRLQLSFLLPLLSGAFTPHPLRHSLPSSTFFRSRRAHVFKTSLFDKEIIVPKTGGAGVVSSSEEALIKSLSLGAPQSRPTGGHYLTKGGVQVTAGH